MRVFIPFAVYLFFSLFYFKYNFFSEKNIYLHDLCNADDLTVNTGTLIFKKCYKNDGKHFAFTFWWFKRPLKVLYAIWFLHLLTHNDMLIAINGFFAVYSKLLLWRARIVLRYDIIIFFSVCNIQRAKRTHFIIFSFLHHFKWYSGRVIKLIITCILYLNILVHLHLCFFDVVLFKCDICANVKQREYAMSFILFITYDIYFRAIKKYSQNSLYWILLGEIKKCALFHFMKKY